MVVMDGLGDRAVEALGWRTPLQAANTPNLDWFAANGSCGIMDVISPGVRPGSDTAHLALLGYDPYEVYQGRGPFEAAGIGLLGQRGDVAFRCNFATVDDEWNVIDRRAGRIKEPDTRELVSALGEVAIDGVEVIVKEATEHRAALIFRGEGLSSKVTDADPHELAKVLVSEPLEPVAERTARLVNEFVKRSYEILKDHPVNVRRRAEGQPEANILLPRGAGTFPDIEPFPQLYGMKAACMAGVGMIKGICQVCGLEVFGAPGATGGLDTDMISKVDRALELLEDHDFVLMNIKAPDIAGHDSSSSVKVEVVKRLDQMAKVLRDRMPEDLVIAFTADHCTPIEVGDHSGDPVPVMIYCQGIVRDLVEEYSEAACSQGGLGRIRGKDLLPILLDKANRSEKFGA